MMFYEATSFSTDLSGWYVSQGSHFVSFHLLHVYFPILVLLSHTFYLDYFYCLLYFEICLYRVKCSMKQPYSTLILVNGMFHKEQDS